MTVRMPRYSKEEFTQRGNDIYNGNIRAQVETEQNKGKFVAIDIETGTWEMDADALTACDRLEARIPDCQTWLVRVGYAYLHRMSSLRRKVAA